MTAQSLTLSLRPDPLTATDAAGPDATSKLPDAHRDAGTVSRLLAGDERTFEALVGRYHASFVRIAMAFVGTRDVAEEVAQETWLAILRGLPRFQGRSSLKNWMYRILTNRAKTRGGREARTVPFTAWRPDREDTDLSLDAEVFDRSGRWAFGPTDWRTASPERRLLDAETEALIKEAISHLPEKQRQVITMRDVAGISSREVRELLDLSETYQRVLLHRARVTTRQALAEHLAEGC